MYEVDSENEDQASVSGNGPQKLGKKIVFTKFKRF